MTTPRRSLILPVAVAALKANKPSGAPTLTDAQVTQLAERIVDNARPGHGPRGVRGGRR